MGGLLHLVQRGGNWAGCVPPSCTKLTAHPSAASVPTTSGPLLGFNVVIKELNTRSVIAG